MECKVTKKIELEMKQIDDEKELFLSNTNYVLSDFEKTIKDTLGNYDYDAVKIYGNCLFPTDYTVADIKKAVGIITSLLYSTVITIEEK